jgi:redoxin
VAGRYREGRRYRVAGFLLAAVALVGVVPVLTGGAAVSLKDADNRWVDPFAAPPSVKAIVFLFTSIDCPISNRYAPVVAHLNERFKPEGVQFWLVYPNPFDTPEAVRQHLKAFAYTSGALLDPDHTLAKLAQATITPEAAVFDREGRERYHGRLDDRFVTLGLERPAPTRHDLEDAISAILAGAPVAQATTQAVGCFISDFVK